MPSLKQKRNYAKTIVILAGVLPLILAIVFTAIDARQTVHQQQVNTANALLFQVEKMSDRSWDMITALRTYQYQPCSLIENKIQREGALNAYFRAIGTIRNNQISCSSTYGINPVSLKKMIMREPPVAKHGWWSLSIARTSGVPHRPAIIFVRQLPDGEGVWALVDGQYLLDFMSALGESHDYHLTLRVNNGAPIETGSHDRAQNRIFKPLTWQASSKRYPVSVSIVAPGDELALAWSRGLLLFLPLAAIFSILLMTLSASWLQRRISWRDEIRRAIRSRHFSVHYQPMYSGRLQRCAGAEALLRWTMPNGEPISPEIFISAAEAEGMIVPLTRHLINLIAEDVREWQVEPGFHLAINVAAEHLQHPDFVRDMLNFADKVKHQQFILTLELTERSLINDGVGVARKLDTLRNDGFKIAIDDFGTGHCSLSYLMNFSLDYLKIARGFIHAIESLENEAPVLDAIINLSHKLRLQVLGEGVETPLQLLYLQQRGVAFIQGYYYARPMNNTAVKDWLKEKEQQPLSVVHDNET